MELELVLLVKPINIGEFEQQLLQILILQKRLRNNNVQIIGLGLRVNGLEYMKQIIDAWYDEPFEFSTARENSKQFIRSRKNDNLLLKTRSCSLEYGI